MDDPNDAEHLANPDALPHGGFLSLEAPAGAYAGVSAAARHRRSRRGQLTAGLAVAAAGALVGGAAAVSGLGAAEERALVPLAAPPRLAATLPPVPTPDSAVPAPVASTTGPTPKAVDPAPSSSRSSLSSSAPSGSPGSDTVPALAIPDADLNATTGCVAASGRAVDATGAPLADLVVARFERGDDGEVATTVAARTGNDGRFTLLLGGSLMLSPTAPGVPQPRSTRNLAPVWVGGGSFPGNPVACGSGADTVLSPGATLVGDHTTPVDGTDRTLDALTVTATAAGSPLALAPAVATITDTGYRFVGLPVGVGAVLVDAFDHRRAFDVTAGSTREDWSSCTTCIAGKPTRGGAAQLDPTAPAPKPSPDEPAPTPTGSPASSGAPSPTGTPPPPPDPAGTPAPTGSATTAPSPFGA